MTYRDSVGVGLRSRDEDLGYGLRVQEFLGFTCKLGRSGSVF